MLRRHALLLPLLAALPGASQAASRRDLPLLAETAAISPAGQAVAYVTAPGRRPAVVAKDFATGRALLRAELGAAPVRRVQWAGEGRLLILASEAGGRTMAYVLDVARRRLTRLLRDAPHARQTIVGLPVVRTLGGRSIVYLQAAAEPGRTFVSLVRADLDPLSVQLAAAGGAGSRAWVVDELGEPAAVELYDPAKRRWTLRVRTAGGWREAHSAAAGPGAFRLLGLARDGKAVLYAAREPGGGLVWREARLDGAPAAGPLVLPDAAEPLHDPQDGRVIGYAAPAGGEVPYAFFDPEDAAAWKAVARAFPGDRVRLASWSADRRRILALVDSSADGPAYAQVDLASRVATWIGPDSAFRPGRPPRPAPGPAS